MNSSPPDQPTTNHGTGTSDFEQNICLKGKNVMAILFQGGARNVRDQRYYILRGGGKTKKKQRTKATLESSSFLFRYLQVSHLLNTKTTLGEKARVSALQGVQNWGNSNT